MSVIVHHQRGTLTASSGRISTNVVANHSILNHIYIKPTHGSTTFDMKFTDIYSNDTFERTDNTGCLNELLELPAYGNWTFTILNASNDEDFTYLFAFRES